MKNLKLSNGQLVSTTPRKTTISISTSSLVGIFDVYVKEKALLKYVLAYKFSQVGNYAVFFMLKLLAF